MLIARIMVKWIKVQPLKIAFWVLSDDRSSRFSVSSNIRSYISSKMVTSPVLQYNKMKKIEYQNVSCRCKH